MGNIERKTIFISHALPEDNEFVLWLAIKLKNEGYDVWCELEQVHGGEHFWKEIQHVLETRTIKFILVASQTSVKKDGVRTEWDFARELQRQEKLKDFIIPINLDGVNSNSIIGLTSLAMIQFQNSWAHGLKALISKLIKDNVVKSQHFNPLSVKDWYFNKYSTVNNPIEKEEIFYSNWVKFPNLPNTLYLHQYSNEVQAKHALLNIREKCTFPASRHEKYILTFEETIPPIEYLDIENLFTASFIKPNDIIKLSVSEIWKRKYKSNVFPVTQDAANFLVQHLQQTVHTFLIKHGLKTYELANEKICYFYKRIEGEDYKIKYLYQDKLRIKQLTGTYYNDDVWHYGVSFVVKTNPYPLISFKSHLLFSTDGVQIWDDKAAIHAARRKKGKRFFNAEWRDLLLAFLGSLSDDHLAFAIPITSNENLWLTTTPVIFKSEFGYIDPKDEGRATPLNDLSNEDEFIDNEYETFDVDVALLELDSQNNEIQENQEEAGEVKYGTT